jgi:hypothetical protein
MFLILLLLAYIISISFWARPLTRNETVWRRKATGNAGTPVPRPNQT